MKKAIAVFFALILISNLVACGSLKDAVKKKVYDKLAEEYGEGSENVEEYIASDSTSNVVENVSEGDQNAGVSLTDNDQLPDGQQYYGVWEMYFFTDSWGDPDYDNFFYASDIIEGRFENSATTNGNLTGFMIASPNYFSFVLNEDIYEVIANSYTDYYVGVMGDDGELFNFDAYSDEKDRQIIIHPYSYYDLADLLNSNRILKIRLENCDDLSRKYFFKIDCTGFAECYKEIVANADDQAGYDATTPIQNNEESDEYYDLTDAQICSLAKEYYLAKNGQVSPIVEIEGDKGSDDIRIHFYEDNGENFATWDWYFINRHTLKGRDIIGDEIDLMKIK